MNVSKTKKKIGNSMKQVAEQTGIPWKHLQIVKVMFPEGFKTNNSLNMERVIEYYEANKELIEQVEKESLDTLKKIEKAIKIQTDELKLAERKRLFISMKDEKEFVQRLATLIDTTLKAKLVNELPDRISAVEKELRKPLCVNCYNEIIELFKKELKKKREVKPDDTDTE